MFRGSVLPEKCFKRGVKLKKRQNSKQYRKTEIEDCFKKCKGRSSWTINNIFPFWGKNILPHENKFSILHEYFILPSPCKFDPDCSFWLWNEKKRRCYTMKGYEESKENINFVYGKKYCHEVSARCDCGVELDCMRCNRIVGGTKLHVRYYTGCPQSVL